MYCAPERSYLADGGYRPEVVVCNASPKLPLIRQPHKLNQNVDVFLYVRVVLTTNAGEAF